MLAFINKILKAIRNNDYKQIETIREVNLEILNEMKKMNYETNVEINEKDIEVFKKNEKQLLEILEFTQKLRVKNALCLAYKNYENLEYDIDALYSSAFKNFKYILKKDKINFSFELDEYITKQAALAIVEYPKIAMSQKKM